MRIDDLNRTTVAAGTEKSGQIVQQRPPEQDGVFSSNHGDQAELSYLAVEQLRLQVQSGSYNVSARALANALIDAHLEE
jgi:anti-sigma28 factor (negative regulator of flagellin synthesis)